MTLINKQRNTKSIRDKYIKKNNKEFKPKLGYQNPIKLVLKYHRLHTELTLG